MSALTDRLRTRLIVVPKPGTEPFEPGPSGITMSAENGAPHKAGDDAGLQTLIGHFGLRPWRVQEHVYAVEPLCAEAAAEIERLTEWADGFSDAHLKERQTGELYQRELRSEIERRDAEIARMHTALLEFGSHSETCPEGTDIGDGMCNCGYSAALERKP